MALMPREPFWNLDRFFEEWPEWPGLELMTTPLKRTPRMDLYEKEGSVVAEVELPGVEAEDIDVEIENRMLKVKAKTERKEEEKDKGYYRREMSRGFYSRAIRLPFEVKEDEAEAKCEDGILRVMIPKKKPTEKKKKKGKKVKVKKE